MSSMLQQTFLVTGSVIGSEVGAELANFNIQLWSLSEDARKPLAEGWSDLYGAFTMEVPIGADLIVENGIARVELRISDQSKLIMAEIRELEVDQSPQTIQLIVPGTATRDRPDVADQMNEPQNQFEVHGRVWGGALVTGKKVRVVLHSLDVEGEGFEQIILGETPVDEADTYRLQLSRPARESSSPMMILEL